MYIAGEYWSELNIQGISISTALTSPRGLFIMKLNNQGIIQWLRNVSGSGIMEFTDLAIDPLGALYLSGFFNDTLTIAEQTLEATDNIDGFLIQINEEGELVWINQFAGRKAVKPESIAVLGDSSVILGG